MKHLAALAPLVLIAACSGASDEPKKDTPAAVEAPAVPATPAAAPANVLTLEGLGDLRIGQPVPAGGTWAELGAQASDECRTVSSKAVPGVYAIVTMDWSDASRLASARPSS